VHTSLGCYEKDEYVRPWWWDPNEMPGGASCYQCECDDISGACHVAGQPTKTCATNKVVPTTVQMQQTYARKDTVRVNAGESVRLWMDFPSGAISGEYVWWDLQAFALFRLHYLNVFARPVR